MIFDDRILHRGGANHSLNDRAVGRFSHRRADVEADTHFEAFRSLQKLRQQVGAFDVGAEFPGLPADASLLDGAAGSQCHHTVVEAVSRQLAFGANVGGQHPHSRRRRTYLSGGARRAGGFVELRERRSRVRALGDGAGGPRRAGAGRDPGPGGQRRFSWRPASPSTASTVNARGDGVLVRPSPRQTLHRQWRRHRRDATQNNELTQADHDSNVQPWVLAAQRAGCEIRYMTVREDGSLDVDALETLVDENTRLIACGLASNGTGTIHDCHRIATLKKNALTFFDGVHYAPHNLIDVQAPDADFLW